MFGSTSALLLCLHWISSAWDVVPAPTHHSLRSVAWTGASFVAVGDSGVVLSSTTGRSWTLESSGTARHLRVVRGNDTLRIAAGDSGTVLANRNQGGWTLSQTGDSSSVQSLAIGPARTVLCNGMSRAVWSGAIGEIWRRDTVAVQGEELANPSSWTGTIVGLSINGIEWDGARFVGFGRQNIVLLSQDGMNWTGSSFTGGGNYRAVARDSAIFFTLSRGSSVPSLTEIMTDHWYESLIGTMTANPSLQPYNAIDARQRRRIVVGDSGMVVSWTSTTPAVRETSGTRRNLGAVAIGDSTTVAVGDSGTILVRHDDLLASSLRPAPKFSRAPTSGQYLSLAEPHLLQAPSAGTWLVTLSHLDGSIAWRGLVDAPTPTAQIRIPAPHKTPTLLRFHLTTP